jgi:hypothetical protein
MSRAAPASHCVRRRRRWLRWPCPIRQEWDEFDQAWREVASAFSLLFFGTVHRFRTRWSRPLLQSCVATFSILCATTAIAPAAAQTLIQPHGTSEPGGRIEFDIPAQPLASALSAYGAATRIPLFVDTELTEGRRSAALKGVFSAEGALKNLLAGTGLEARAIGDQGFTLVSPPSARTGSEARGPGAMSPTILRFNNYSAAIQNAMRAALCHHEETRPGSYRVLVRLWIGASGAVTGTELMTSTGNSARDVLLSDAFQGLVVGTPPPADLPQPVTLLVTSGNRSPGYCPEEGRGLPRADANRERVQ